MQSVVAVIKSHTNARRTQDWQDEEALGWQWGAGMTDERTIRCEGMSLTGSGNTRWFRNRKWNVESGEIQHLCKVHTKKNLVSYAED